MIFIVHHPIDESGDSAARELSESLCNLVGCYFFFKIFFRIGSVDSLAVLSPSVHVA